ncbi:MAG: class I SAM-dependent methyltransferase [Patescibacteria group bacterium]|nr:class I SAM-dependent methyltransferase [Patescibacteria group bacterium]
MEAINLIILLFFLIFILGLFILIIFNLIFELYSQIIKKNSPFVPTIIKKHQDNFDEIFKFLENLGLSGKKFVDLGSGLGFVAFEFAKRNYLSYGIELNPFLISIAKLIKRIKGLKNVNFVRDDIFRYNLGDFDIIYLYQLPAINKKLLSKLENELKEGAIIISHIFRFPSSAKINLIKVVGNNVFFIYRR